MSPQPGSPAALQGVVVVVLMDYQARHRAWGWWRLVRGGHALRHIPGLRFAKVMGSGAGGGFTAQPSGSHQGLIALLDDAAAAQAFLAHPLVLACRLRSRRFWAGLMAVDSSRGAWDGQAWAPTSPERREVLENPGAADGVNSPNQHVLAVLTRASVRPRKALAFWRHAPASQAELMQAAGCTLAVGLGEAPLLRQCTFSLWRGTTAMQAYAQGHAHGQAAQAARREDYFSESLFVRMRLLQQDGQWGKPAQAPHKDRHG